MASAGRRKQIALDSRHQTLVDFLARERQQQARHERVNGVVRMMTGGTVAHNRIARNCARALDDRLQGSNCEVFASDMKIVSPEDDVMYPDAVIVCDDISERATELRTPVVVVELLSESTEARDHGPKRWAYQTIPSLQHYLLVDQGKPVVEVASRNDDGSWRSVIHRGLDARLRLDALGVEIGLDEVFARIAFAPAAPGGEPAPTRDRTDQINARRLGALDLRAGARYFSACPWGKAGLAACSGAFRA